MSCFHFLFLLHRIRLRLLEALSGIRALMCRSGPSHWHRTPHAVGLFFYSLVLANDAVFSVVLFAAYSGAHVVGLFNGNDSPSDPTVLDLSLFFPATTSVDVRDLWQHSDVGASCFGLRAAAGCFFCVLSDG